MSNIIEDPNRTSNSSTTLYVELAEVCKRIRKKPESQSDVGSGKYSRFQTTNNKVYNNNKVIVAISKMNCIFATYSKKMNDINNIDDIQEIKLKHKFSLYHDLMNEFISKNNTNNNCSSQEDQNQSSNIFKGFGVVCTNHLISLASLFGIIPIDFYINVPLHSNGGVGMFLRERFN